MFDPNDVQAPRQVYSDHVDEASKPISQRASVVVGRLGTLPPRRHHLTVEDQERLQASAEKEGRFISPFKKFGAYDGVIEALSRLGEGETHILGQVLGEFEAYMSDSVSKDKRDRTAWERFRDRKARSKNSGLDHMGRFQQNIQVLQRLGGDHPYGLKLAQLGCCIDILKGDKGQQLVRLRTRISRGDEVKPLNEFKTRKCSRSRESYPSMITFRSGTES